MDLSRLKIEDDKIDKFQNDFSQILDYVSELQKLETEENDIFPLFSYPSPDI